MGNAESKGTLEISSPRPLSAINLHPDSPSSSSSSHGYRRTHRRSISDFSFLSASASMLSLRKRPSQQQLSLDFAPSRPTEPSSEVRQRASLTSLRRSGSGAVELREGRGASSESRRTRSDDNDIRESSSRQEQVPSSSSRRHEHRRRHSLAIDFGGSARTDISPSAARPGASTPHPADSRVASSSSRNAFPSVSSRSRDTPQTASYANRPTSSPEHFEPDSVGDVQHSLRSPEAGSITLDDVRSVRRRTQSSAGSDTRATVDLLRRHHPAPSQRSVNPSSETRLSRRSLESNGTSGSSEQDRPSEPRHGGVHRRVHSCAQVPPSISSSEPFRRRVNQANVTIPVVDSTSDTRHNRGTRRVSSSNELSPRRPVEDNALFDVPPISVAAAPPPPYSLFDPHSDGSTPPPILPVNGKERLSVPRRSDRHSRQLRVVSTEDSGQGASGVRSEAASPSPSSTSISLSPSSQTLSLSPSPSPASPPVTTSGSRSLTEQSSRSSTSARSSAPSTSSVPVSSRGSRGHRTGTRHTQNAVVYPRTTSISTADLPVDNPLQLLRRYKAVFIVDDSNSMKKRNRWSETKETLASLAVSAATYGLEGIDVHFLNSSKFGTNLRDEQEVKRLFDSISPRGITIIATKLENLLQDYMFRLEKAQTAEMPTRLKAVNYIVITDGISTDDPVPVIIQTARRLDEGSFPLTQVGLQFIQIGSDPRATEALRKLHDTVLTTKGVRNIVDTTPYTPGHRFSSDMVIKALLIGINKRVVREGRKREGEHVINGEPSIVS